MKYIITSFFVAALINPSCNDNQGDFQIVDNDHDYLSDHCERDLFGTDPSIADTDGDTITDNDEDHDGDGCSNFEEQERTVVCGADYCRCEDYLPGVEGCN